MTERKAEEQVKADAAASGDAKPAKKSGLMMYILIGVGGIVVVTGILVGVLMFMKDKPTDTASSEVVTDSTAIHASAKEANADGHSKDVTPHEKNEDGAEVELSEADLAALDSAFVQDSQGVLKEVTNNLAFLDYKPTEGDISGQPIEAMSTEDSLEALDWLEKEQTRLEKKETELTSREQQLNKLNSEVTKKINRIEQAETARIGTLAKMYDGMDPKSVAKLMADLDDQTIVSILPRMKTNNASSVMGLLPPPRAAKLSKQMITIADGDTK